MANNPRILIVDDSRIVRVSLANHLKGHFDIREEGDGEAAWQTLVLDHSIQAVISDLQMPKLDGYGLLDRLRTSKLKRLKDMPFILVSGEETEEERAKAKSLGVSDFITKGAGTAEILTRLNNLLALTKAQEKLEEGREQMVQDPKTGIFTRKYLELQTAQALSRAARYHGEVSVMVLGLDNFAAIGERLGADMADQVAGRLAKMLNGKIRQEDSLGHFGAGQYAIVSPSCPPATCAGFAERVRVAVEAAQVAAQGQRLPLTVSVGVASVPLDRVVSAGTLLELAGKRMQDAMHAGGNRVVVGGQGFTAPAPKVLTLPQALEMLRTGRAEAVLPHLGPLGLQVLPLLQMLEKELSLGLPLADIEKKLRERAP